MMKVNNINLHYIEEGEGEALLLLHGNGEDSSIFAPLMAKLKSDFKLYAIDSRNHGQSSKTDSLSYNDMVEDTYQFIKKLKLKDVSVIGFSDGAIIATSLELKYPNSFSKMIVLGINLQPTDFKEEYYNQLLDAYEETGDPLIKMMLEEPQIQLTDLSKIEAPCLVVRAENELFHDNLYEQIVDVMPNAKLKIIYGHDHGSYIIESDILYKDILGFLASK